MLVLSRKVDESIVLQIKTSEEEITEVLIKVIDIGSRKVRLGFETDQNVTILRQELVKSAV